MTSGLQGSGRKKPCLQYKGLKMTKRETQAREYAAESHERTPAKRGVSHMRVTEHWLTHARGRIIAGDDELEVLADYGWVQITDEEREAIEIVADWACDHLGQDDPGVIALRSLLERLK